MHASQSGPESTPQTPPEKKNKHIKDHPYQRRSCADIGVYAASGSSSAQHSAGLPDHGPKSARRAGSCQSWFCRTPASAAACCDCHRPGSSVSSHLPQPGGSCRELVSRAITSRDCRARVLLFPLPTTDPFPNTPPSSPSSSSSLCPPPGPSTCSHCWQCS